MKNIPAKNSYNKILSNIINHIEQSKLRAFTAINKALLYAYWNIGRELSKNSSYGKSVVEQLSRDLRLKYPEAKGYSVRNLWNMKRFYETYNQKLQPVAGELIYLYRLNKISSYTISFELKIHSYQDTSSSNPVTVVQQPPHPTRSSPGGSRWFHR